MRLCKTSKFLFLIKYVIENDSLKTLHLNDSYGKNNFLYVCNNIKVDQNVLAKNNNAYSEFVNVSDNDEQLYESKITPFMKELNLNSHLLNKNNLPTLLSKYIKILEVKKIFKPFKI